MSDLPDNHQQDSNHNSHEPRRISISLNAYFEDTDGWRTVYFMDKAIFSFNISDSQMYKLASVNLFLSNIASHYQIAHAFGHSVASQRAWVKKYLSDGSDAFNPKPHSGRPPKVQPNMHDFVQRWFHQGISNTEIARRLGTSEATVRRILIKLKLCRDGN